MQDLGHEGNARPQLSGQSDTGDETQRCVGRKGGDHAVRNVRQGVQEDGAEHDLEPPLPVAQNTPDDPADQHAGHLHIKEKYPVVGHVLAGQTQRSEARHAHDAEEHQVVDVHEITEGCDNDRQAEDMTEMNTGFLFHRPLQNIR